MTATTDFFKKLFASPTKLESLFTRLTPLLLVLLGVLVLVLVVLYSLYVSLTGQIQQQTAKAKTTHEENLTLEVELNQLRSYANLNADIRQLKHLVATEHKLQLKPQPTDLNQPILNGTLVVKRTPPYSPMAGY
jgi:predicted PurR-regulated permease PerM